MKIEIDLNECMELHALLGMRIYQLENSRIMTEQLKSFLDLDKKLLEKLTKSSKAKNEINDNSKKLLELIKENPELEIIPCVSDEITCAGDCNYTIAEWGNAYIEDYCIYDGAYYYDKDEFIEDWIADNSKYLDELYGDDEEAIEREAKKQADERFEKAIIVYID